jgi:hypothetical protein
MPESGRVVLSAFSSVLLYVKPLALSYIYILLPQPDVSCVKNSANGKTVYTRG